MNDERPQIDPVVLLNSLSASELEGRLDQINGESKALHILLRSVRARERARQQYSRREESR